MRSIGIRELRQHASKYLRLVKEGESIEITERGDPVAMLTPVPREESVLERLRREGRLIPPKKPGDILDIERAPPEPGVPLPTESLMTEREEDWR